ncbi:hypothetical protein D3C77_744930 [compost metagenome]
MGIYKHGHMTTLKLNNGQLDSTLAGQHRPGGQQRFEQQHAIEIGLGQDLLALGEDPVLNFQDFALAALLRQVLHNLAHIAQA